MEYQNILNQDALASLIRREALAAIKEYFQTHRELDIHDSKSRYLSRREVANYLSIGLSTVDFWVRTGRLDKIKVGRAMHFDRNELDASLEKLRKYVVSSKHVNAIS